MPEQILARCPSCGQKYRIPAAALGREAHCRKCGVRFAVKRPTPIDEGTILSWLSETDESSDSVMGATGIFPESPETRAVSEAQPVGARLRLVSVDDHGAHFEFSADLLARTGFRNSFPRRCVGCGAREGLEIHLIQWPERMSPDAARQWKEREDEPIGKLEAFRNAFSQALLNALPATPHVRAPFHLPFPVFACARCRVTREIRASVVRRNDIDLCLLTIASLFAAVDFYRNAGGTNTAEYRHLLHDRDAGRDPWHHLGSALRRRLSRWFDLRAGERFLGYFAPADTLPAENGCAGAVLTDRRLALRAGAASSDCSLNEHYRLSVEFSGDGADVRLFREAHRPASLTLTKHDANRLLCCLQNLDCWWTIDA